MLLKPIDESDYAFDAYFSWLTDRSMSFSYFGGGGGAGGGHVYHYGTMGSGYYDVGNYTLDDLIGSLWNATTNNTIGTFTNVNGSWYHTSTSIITLLYDFDTNMAMDYLFSHRPSLATMPDVTRDWLEYHGIMQNEYRSKGTLDWIHYDRYGNRSCTQYSAISGAGNYEAPTIDAGNWTAYKLELSPFTIGSNADSFYGNDGWGFKVRLEDQFGRTGILIHPGMNLGTLGCIGLSDNNQLFDFLNRICNYDLSPNHTLIIKVSYGN